MKESYAVLKSNPQLSIFPVVSGVVSLIVAASFFIPLALTSGILHSRQHQLEPVHYVVLFAFYVVSYFVVIFFNAGLVSCAHDSLMGRPTSFKQGMANAGQHVGPILIWSLIAATVGTILRYIGERTGFIGQIIVGLLGAVWTVVTYFVVPIIIFENAAPFGAIKKSGGMLKTTWGERIIGGVSIGMATGVLSLIGFAFIVAAVAVAISGAILLAIPFVVLAVMYWLALAIFSTTLTGIFQTALYVYASSGQVPQGFSAENIQGAFMQKPQKGVFGK